MKQIGNIITVNSKKHSDIPSIPNVNDKLKGYKLINSSLNWKINKLLLKNVINHITKANNTIEVQKP
jgi:hypothetical protein